jgi:hypothetical protein
MNGAAAALRRVAADVGSSQAEVVPDQLDQERSLVDVDRLLLTVDRDGDRGGAHLRLALCI